MHPAPGTLFTTRAGTPVTHIYYGSELFSAAVKRAGLLLAAGGSVVAAAERLGHENASLVLTTYGHLMPDSEERTRRAVDEAWCAITVPSEESATRWPARRRSNDMFHLDISVADVDAAEPRVLQLGARWLPGGGGDFRVYADPVGHPFCLVGDA